MIPLWSETRARVSVLDRCTYLVRWDRQKSYLQGGHTALNKILQFVWLLLLWSAAIGVAHEVMPEFSETFGLRGLLGWLSCQQLAVVVGNSQRFATTKLRTLLPHTFLCGTHKQAVYMTKYVTVLCCKMDFWNRRKIQQTDNVKYCKLSLSE